MPSSLVHNDTEWTNTAAIALPEKPELVMETVSELDPETIIKTTMTIIDGKYSRY